MNKKGTAENSAEPVQAERILNLLDIRFSVVAVGDQ